MPADLPFVTVPNRARWSAWLKKYHAKSKGIWLVYFKPHTRKPTVPYEDSVLEALCFGWVDSLIKRIDDDRYARKFTPRKAGSSWSDSNRARYKQLQAAGLLAAAGKAAAPTSRRSEATIPKMPARIPQYIMKAMRRNAKAWRAFSDLTKSHRREIVLWIHSAKQIETKQRRLAKAIAMLAAGSKPGILG